MKKLLFLAIGICSSLSFVAHAQTERVPERHHEIGISVGAANYYGDLQHNWFPTQQNLSQTYRPSLGIQYKYFFNPRLGMRFGATYLQITAADSLSTVAADKQRNLNFTNDMFEGYGAVEFNILPIRVEDRFKVSPYVFAGIGAVYSNPYTNDREGKKTRLRDLGTEGQGVPGYPDRKTYSMVHAMFPVGGGVKFFIGKTVVMSAEVGLRYVASDYIDDVSRSYINMDTLLAYKGQKAVDLSYRGNEIANWDGNYPDHKFQRGDFKKNDWYYTVGISATIYFDAFGNLKRFIQGRCPRIYSSF